MKSQSGSFVAKTSNLKGLTREVTEAECLASERSKKEAEPGESEQKEDSKHHKYLDPQDQTLAKREVQERTPRFDILIARKERRWRNERKIRQNKVFIFVNYPKEGREIGCLTYPRK